MDARHEEKIKELVKALANAIEKKALRLADAGILEESDFDADEYRFAKLIITAAARSECDAFAPLSDKYREELKNLSYF